MSDVPDLLQTAEATRVVVIGAGIAGLVAAHEFAKVGMPVAVFDAAAPGGCVRTVSMSDAAFDAGATGFTLGGAVDRLVDELNASGAGLERAAVHAHERSTPIGGSVVPLPPGVLGIPANPLREDVLRVVGWGGGLRGYLDRLRPPLTIGHQRDLARLVRSRLGATFLQRLVTPVTIGRFGIDPTQVDVEVAAPALNAALTRAGSLTGAVAELLEQPSSELATLRGGMARLVDALVARITELGGAVHSGVPVLGLARSDAGDWLITHAPMPAGADENRTDEPDAERAAADLVVVATDEGPARVLLAESVSLPAPAAWSGADVVTVLLAAPSSDASWGAGVLPQPGARVEAIDDLTAQWGASADGDTVLRAKLRVTGSGTIDTNSVADEVGTMLGTTVRPLAVERFPAAPAVVQLGLPAWSAQVTAADWPRGLGATGAWIVGAGLDPVVRGAQATAERLRRAALFT